MNLELFNQLLKECHPGQNAKEWQYFLEFADYYFRTRSIKNPVVVEVGISGGCQQIFYEKILGAEYIGIDFSDKYSKPTIQGNSSNPQTLKQLKDILRGRTIDLLFIDADHSYDGVKSDFEIYGSLTKHIIAFHDIRTEIVDVRKFWEELMWVDNAWIKMSVYQKNILRPYQYGIGIIVKE